MQDTEFLRANTERTVKVTIPGPFTMSQQAQDDFYGDGASLALAYAEACNAEVKDLFERGPTSSSSTSPTCRLGPMRPASSVSPR